MAKNLRDKLALSTLSVALLALAGCGGLPDLQTRNQAIHATHTEVPLARNFEVSHQLKLQAAEHWQRAANDAAGELVNSLTRGGGCLEQSSCPTLIVVRPCHTKECQPKACDTEFRKVFFNQFVTALVNMGQRVTHDARGPGLRVEMDIQPLRFNENRPQYRFAGEATELGQGVWALRDVAVLKDVEGNLIQPQDVNKLHWNRAQFAAGQTPASEVVITVSAMDVNRTYLARNTSAYYFADSDAKHFFCPDELAQRNTGLPVSNISVVGDCSDGRCVSQPGAARPQAAGK